MIQPCLSFLRRRLLYKASDASFFRAKILAIFSLATLSLSGCHYFQPKFQTTPHCKSRAYVRSTVTEQLTMRNNSGIPRRLAIIPFSVPANLAPKSNELPGLGNKLAWRVQAESLASGEIPLVEVFNRQDWPGKKEEFFTGNFGTLDRALAAGYDFALIGLVDDLNSLDSFAAYTKVIDISSGTTVWYGYTSVSAKKHEQESVLDSMFRSTDDPSKLFSNQLIDELARCIVQGVVGSS